MASSGVCAVITVAANSASNFKSTFTRYDKRAVATSSRQQNCVARGQLELSELFWPVSTKISAISNVSRARASSCDSAVRAIAE
jgi:hypothetical protein